MDVRGVLPEAAEDITVTLRAACKTVPPLAPIDLGRATLHAGGRPGGGQEQDPRAREGGKQHQTMHG